MAFFNNSVKLLLFLAPTVFFIVSIYQFKSIRRIKPLAIESVLVLLQISNIPILSQFVGVKLVYKFSKKI